MIAWQAAGYRTVSRAETIGMGGIFLYTRTPPAKGSMVELMLDIGADGVRARAIVRHVRPEKGMGVQFAQMRPEDRARLNQFLTWLKANPNQDNASAPSGPKTPRRQPAEKSHGTVERGVAVDEFPSAKRNDGAEFEQELKAQLELASTGTYYQLLGVTPDANKKEVKEKFYSLARKFHPDHHMDSKWVKDLQKLMEVITAAYKTLENEQTRAGYDKRLTASGAFNLERAKTESQETVEECLERANECLKAKNFAGSIIWLRKCVIIAPEVGKYHAILARSLANVAGCRNDAIDHFERAIELDPWNTAAYFYFAELYEKMRLPWRAYPLYCKVLEIDPGHVKARERLTCLDSNKKQKGPRKI